MLAILAVRRQTQEELEFEVSLGYKENSRPLGYIVRPCLKK
jgi:hypothetical protein